MQTDLPLGLNISAVERETGLTKELLRIWERRYGFPQPARDAQGDRVYTPEQVDKLRLLRRLLDRGMRPSKIVGSETAELMALLERMAQTQEPKTPNTDVDPLIDCLSRRDLGELQRYLQGELVVRGLRDFVSEFMPRANVRVGEAWFAGEIGVWQEHCYVEQVSQTVRMAMFTLSQPLNPPKVLLTTPAGEQHGLGLLMVEAMLRMQGCQTWSLGLSLPLDDIVAACCELGCDVLAMSLSSTYPQREASDLLAQLRQRLPAGVSIWLGGAGSHNFKRLPEGIDHLGQLADVIPAVGAWRKARKLD
ncbi:MerR family transcriptional regulator [Chitinimonas sp. BJYL2]|uniref:MerR family transcriptional regulator n=1 Tax=Chitinimonas sp. BJYL2 TaxID=2976696 RepID=UPI0022B2D3D7|nr:MerR family transcriptional regulator [Chitinimonas sp. BJYL2]